MLGLHPLGLDVLVALPAHGELVPGVGVAEEPVGTVGGLIEGRAVVVRDVVSAGTDRERPDGGRDGERPKQTGLIPAHTPPFAIEVRLRLHSREQL